MATIRYDVGGIEVELKTPSLSALTALKQARTIDHAELRDFCKSMMSKDEYLDLLKRKPACWRKLGEQALVDWGVDEAIMKLLDPDEIEDPAFADAYREAEEFSRKAFPSEDDDRGKIYPFMVTVRDTDRAFLMRAPQSEMVVDRLRKAKTAEAAKKYCDDHIVWPKDATAEWLEYAPGLFLLVSEKAMDLAGDMGVRRLGE